MILKNFPEKQQPSNCYSYRRKESPVIKIRDISKL
jgi:hypothetical protein